MAGATSWQHALRMREVPSDVGFFGWFWLDKISDEEGFGWTIW